MTTGTSEPTAAGDSLLETVPQGRTLAAMSGGVDSSVSALMLLERGFDVAGATMKLHSFATSSEPFEAEGVCGSSSDLEDARLVCERLGIPWRALDMEQEFSREVVERFCDAYLSGDTPNPCICCNRYLKFGCLHDVRQAEGFDYLATGHYARTRFDQASGRWQLLRGADAQKDQSYVLFSLTQQQLAHTLFPLGELTKEQVRELAMRHGFANAQKAESQDICFIPDGDYAGFLARAKGESVFVPGEIVNREGRVLGEHTGLARYTIGQRKGLGIAWSEPLYVYSKDIEHNRLIVDVDTLTKCTSINVKDVNFIAYPRLEKPLRFTVKTHYRQKDRPALVEQTGDTTLHITFAEPQRACATGQFAVIYENDHVVAGGEITA